MCLAVPAKLVKLEGTCAIADLHGNRVEISTLLVPHCKQGDWVLLHAGFAIQTLNEREAQETWAVVKDLGMGIESSIGADVAVGTTPAKGQGVPR